VISDKQVAGAVECQSGRINNLGILLFAAHKVQRRYQRRHQQKTSSPASSHCKVDMFATGSSFAARMEKVS
jgi:hypothetical protein